MPPTTTNRGRHRRRLAVLAAVLVAGTGFAIAPVSAAVATPTPAAPASLCPDASSATFGPNVCVFNDTMAQTAIQADIDAISTLQVPITSQFDTGRYTIFFEPGTYGSTANPLIFQVGYYTEVAGLGYLPSDTTINGLIESFANDCGNRPNGNPPVTQYWCNSTTNFWRSLSNLTLNTVTNDDTNGPPNYAPAVVDPYGPYCTNSEEAWSVSQAAPIRRAIINGSVVFQDYCAQGSSSNPARDDASGGFIADSEINAEGAINGDLDFYGQQQYITRNSTIEGANGCGAANGGLWNMVYAGVTGATITPEFGGQCDQNTVQSTNPVTEESPFLYQDAKGGWRAFVPSVLHNSSGTSWSSGTEAGSSLPLNRFFIANPTTPVLKINLALLLGQNLILEPGIYHLNSPIVVSRPNTVVLGLGFATLIPQRGNAALVALPNNGVKISGLIIDAGAVNSPVLLSVGTGGPGFSAAANPDLVSDVSFGIGGAQLGKANVSFLDLAPNSIIDDLWAWRADHGNTGTVGWTTNTAATGVYVGADNVTAYGLAVEHFQKNEVIWAGQGGDVTFFQNELPYDPPTQSAWMATPTQDGYPAFDVTPNVKTFTGLGMGSYVVFTQTAATIYDAEAFQAPQVPGVRFTNTFGVWIGGSGGLTSIIDGVGGPVTSTNPGLVVPVDVASFH
jgi:hypothetical protein